MILLKLNDIKEDAVRRLLRKYKIKNHKVDDYFIIWDNYLNEEQRPYLNKALSRWSKKGLFIYDLKKR